MDDRDDLMEAARRRVAALRDAELDHPAHHRPVDRQRHVRPVPDRGGSVDWRIVAAAVGVVAVLILFSGCMAPMEAAPPAAPPAPVATGTPRPAPTAAPTAPPAPVALVDAGHAPGDTLFRQPTDSITMALAGCYGEPGWVEVATVDETRVWVARAQLDMGDAAYAGLPYAPGECAPPAPTPAPRPYVPAPAQAAPTVAPAPTPCPPPWSATGCANLVEVTP